MREDAKRGMIDPGRGTEQGTVLALSFVVAFAIGPIPGAMIFAKAAIAPSRVAS
jgi:hypothetical protein